MDRAAEVPLETRREMGYAEGSGGVYEPTERLDGGSARRRMYWPREFFLIASTR